MRKEGDGNCLRGRKVTCRDLINTPREVKEREEKCISDLNFENGNEPML